MQFLQTAYINKAREGTFVLNLEMLQHLHYFPTPFCVYLLKIFSPE